MSEVGRQPLVLMAEDDAIVGLDLCDALVRGGFRVAGPLDTNAEASACIERGTPAVAILKIRLKDGPTDDLALMLRRRGVPILMHTESDSAASRTAALAGTPWLSRPAWHRDVVDVLGELTARAAQTGSRS